MRRMYAYTLCGLLALLWASGVARADHWTSRAEVAKAAHDLADRAEHFHELLHDLSKRSHVASAAHRLADSAEHFHRSVEQGASYRHALRDFERVRRDFFHLSQDYRQAHDAHHNRHVQRDWRRLSSAFEDLSRAMGVRGSEAHDHHHR